MIINRITLFKRIPPEKQLSYKDPHRKIHQRNIESVKKEIKAEKKKLLREAEKEIARDIQQHKKAVSEFNDRYRKLHII